MQERKNEQQTEMLMIASCYGMNQSPWKQSRNPQTHNNSNYKWMLKRKLKMLSRKNGKLKIFCILCLYVKYL